MAITMDIAAPAFDLDMEVLCTLTREPLPTAMIRDDFNLSTMEFRWVLKRLRKRFDVKIICGCGRVGMAGSGVTRAKAAAEQYWQAMYGA